MKVYPFLWGKSENFKGDKLIAIPSFVLDFTGPARDMLGRTRKSIDLQKDEVCLLRFDDPAYGTLDMAYRRVLSPYEEKGGRSFFFTEGFVLRGRDDCPTFCTRHFDMARSEIQKQYDNFIMVGDPSEWNDLLASHKEHIEISAPEAGDSPLRVREIRSESASQSGQEREQETKSSARTEWSDVGGTPNASRRTLEQMVADAEARQTANWSERNNVSSDGPTRQHQHSEVDLIPLFVKVVGAAIVIGTIIYLVRRRY